MSEPLRPLTELDRRFVAHYLVNEDGAKAAIAAGYSKNGAKQSAFRALNKPEVAAAITQGRAKLLAKAAVTAERVTAELAKIGFCDIRNAVRWTTVTDAKGRQVQALTLVDSADLDDATAGAISEISQNAKGELKIKFHDKRAALETLGRHLGMFTDNVNLNAQVTFIIEGLPGFQPQSIPALEAR